MVATGKDVPAINERDKQIAHIKDTQKKVENVVRNFPVYWPVTKRLR